MSEEEDKKKEFHEQAQRIIAGIGHACMQLAAMNPTIGFQTIFESDGRRYSVTFAEEVGQFSYLKDN